jgi:hypothetical protein
MTMEWAVSLLSLSIPVTVAIIKFVPRRERTSMGVTPREFRMFTKSVDDKFEMVRADIREIRQRIDERL